MALDDRSWLRTAVFVVGFGVGAVAVGVLPGAPTIVVDGGAPGAASAPIGPGAGDTTTGPSDPAGAAGTSVAAPGDDPSADGGGGASTPARPGSSTAPVSAPEPGAPTVAPPAGTATPPDDSAEPARGVSADAVRVGMAVLDIGALRHLGPDYNIGDGEEQMEAWLAGVRKDGLLPVHGRDLDVRYRRHAPTALDAASQRESCQGLVTDEKVFAVVAGAEYPVGGECVAREHRTPVLATNGVNDETYARSAPYLFTLQLGLDRLVRNWVRWADERGFLEGRTIGLYLAGGGASDGRQQAEMRDAALIPALAEVGQQIAVQHETDQPLGGPQDGVAAHRFRTEGVDLAILWTSKTGFMQQAEAQGYQPTYIESDYKAGTNDAQSNRHPPQQFDETLGMTAVRWGEASSGIPPNDLARTCEGYFREHTGRVPDRESAEYGAMNGTCDLGWVLLEALRSAGPAPTADGFVAGMQGIVDFPLAGHFTVSFGPGKYDGTDQQRTLQWTADCTCWQVLTPPGPLWVR